jgi:hypothetical protein
MHWPSRCYPGSRAPKLRIVSIFVHQRGGEFGVTWPTEFLDHPVSHELLATSIVLWCIVAVPVSCGPSLVAGSSSFIEIARRGAPQALRPWFATRAQ